MAPATVEALWVGPFVAECGGQTLVPYESTFRLPLEEAEASDNWEVGIKVPKGAKTEKVVELVRKAREERAAGGETPPVEEPADEPEAGS